MVRTDLAEGCVACPWCKAEPVSEYVREAGNKHDVLYCPNFESADESTQCPVMPILRQNLRENREQMVQRWNSLYNLVPAPVPVG